MNIALAVLAWLVCQTVPVPGIGNQVTGGSPSIALVSHCVATNTGTCTIDTTGATLIIVDQLTGGTGTLGAAPTENKGNTFQVPAATTCANGTSGVVQAYYIYNPTVGSSHIFTGHASSNVYFVSAWSGTDTTSAVYDTGNCHSQGGGGGTTFQPGSITPAATNEVVFTMAFNVDSGTGTWTVPTSFSVVNTSTGYGAESTAYYVYPSTSALNPTWTNLNNQNFVGNIAVFKHQ